MTKFIILLSNIIEMISRILIISYIVKYFNIEIYGEYSFYLIVSQFIGYVGLLGIGPLLIKEKNNEVFHQIYNLLVLLMVIIVSISMLYNLVIGTLVLFFYSLSLYRYIATSFGVLRRYSISRTLIYLIQLMILSSLHFNNYIFDIEMLIVCLYLPTSIILIFEIIKFFKFKVIYQFTITELNTFIKFNFFANITQYGSQLSERFIIKIVVDDYLFGIYSLIRDMLRAFMFLFLLPIQLTAYKKLFLYVEEKAVNKISKIEIIIFIELLILTIILFTCIYLSLEYTTISEYVPVVSSIKLNLTLLIIATLYILVELLKVFYQYLMEITLYPLEIINSSILYISIVLILFFSYNIQTIDEILLLLLSSNAIVLLYLILKFRFIKNAITA